MNGLIKKISTGLLAVAIAVMGVATLGTVNTYAAGEPCEGARISGETIDFSGAVRPQECSVCIGTQMANGQTSTSSAFAKCQNSNDNFSIDSIWGWVYQIINWVLIAVGIICVVFIIIGGIRYATSGGDPEKLTRAKNTILYALIGLVIAILATVIVQIVFNVTGAITR